MNSGMADILLSGVETILKDSSFSTCSPVAAGVLTSTKLLKEWCIHKENNASATHFTKELLNYLERALIFPTGCHLLNKEKIWQQYFIIRSSNTFISLESLLGKSKCDTSSNTLPASH